MSAPLWVTGVGLVTPLGSGVAATWNGLVAGQRAIRPIQRFTVSGQRSQVAGEVDGIEAPGPGWSRTSAMAACAAAEAMRAARLDVRALRVGLVIGSTTGGMLETEQLLGRLHGDPDSGAVLAAMLSHPLTATGDRLAERLGPFARVRMLASACSSGANAMLVAASWLLEGELDAVVAGGTDGLCRLTLSGFNALGALDPEPCRPFDRSRRGTSLGEGAGFVVLERADTARRRAVVPVAELAGWASGSEAHHITNPASDGEVVAGLVRRALSCAGFGASDVDYVNAHGTGTPANDSMEAAALALGLGAEIRRIPVSSSKGQLGHSLGAAGAIEAALTALVVQRRVLPPTAGLDEPDPGAPLVHVRGQGRAVPRVRAALSCAFGFGGMDTVLAFGEAGREQRPDDGPARLAVITGVAVVGGQCGIVSGEACATLPDRASGGDADLDLDARLDPARARRLDHSARLAVVVVEAALDDAGTRDAATGLVLGSAYGNVDASASFMHRIFEKGPRAASPAEFPNLVPSASVGHTSIYLGLRGPAFATADLGTSGESAFAQAFQLVSCGEAPRIVAGSLEPRSGIVQRVLSALFAPGHAARGKSDVSAAVVLEDAAEAKARGRRVLARVAQVIEWRQDPAGALAKLLPPRGTRCEVVTGRMDDDVDGLLARTAWHASPRRSCDLALGESDGLGGVALAVAAARIAAGLADDVLVAGLDDGRGTFVVLSAV